VTRFRAHTLAENETVRHIMDSANAVLVERDGAVVVYDVEIPPRTEPARASA
jgi:hypothetical protein